MKRTQRRILDIKIPGENKNRKGSLTVSSKTAALVREVARIETNSKDVDRIIRKMAELYILVHHRERLNTLIDVG